MSTYKKVAFTVYPVTDVPRAREFYEQTIGLTVGLHGGQDGMYWVEYDLPGGGCFAISNAVEGQPSASDGGTVAFEVDDLARVIDELKGKGVAFKTDVIRGPSCQMIVCLDSEGNSLLLHQHDQA